jgi:hypothetical protein
MTKVKVSCEHGEWIGQVTETTERIHFGVARPSRARVLSEARRVYGMRPALGEEVRIDFEGGATVDSLYERLLAYETDGARPADGRRVIRDERVRLHAAYDARTRARAECQAGANAHVKEVETEAERVLGMWS